MKYATPRPSRRTGVPLWQYALLTFVGISIVGALVLVASVDTPTDPYHVGLGLQRTRQHVQIQTPPRSLGVAPGFRATKQQQEQHSSLRKPSGDSLVASSIAASYNFKVFMKSPAPSPPTIIPNTRKCECVENWRELKAKGESVCTCGGVKCPSKVDPLFLTEATGQYVCTLRERTAYNCHAACKPDGEVLWFAESCGGTGQPPCDALIVTPSPTPTVTPTNKPPVVVPRTTWNAHEVYDFRGGGCELLNGEKVCYMEDRQGRERCPSYVTLEYLANGPPEYPLCHPDHADRYYCTIQCQEGNEVVRWGVHDIEDCHTPENFGNCPPRPTVVPKKDFVWREWTEKQRRKTSCRIKDEQGIKGELLPDLTVGLLTHEPKSFADSMATYEKYGLFDLVPEFIIYINNRNRYTDAVADEYKAKYPDKIKVMGDETNKGIARGIVELTNAASHPYFLFLERDFQLIEPSACVYEQLRAGIDLVKSKAADVVRYRSRWKAGRPNWALRFFYGHEDDAFRGRQPNLGCNTHYWVENPHERWPQYVRKCGDDPEMLCSDSFYCNWTNNPQLWEIDWWNREYVSRLDNFVSIDPWQDLELYMNWEPNSWNDRRFTVAQGEGLFKHMDRNNIVHV